MPWTGDTFPSLAPAALLFWTTADLLGAVALALVFARLRKEKTRPVQSLPDRSAAQELSTTEKRESQQGDSQVRRLLDRELAQVRRLENLRTASANIAIEVGLGGLLRSITGNAAVLLDAQACEAVLFDPEVQEIFHTLGGEETNKPSILNGSQIQQNILNSGRSVLLNPPAAPSSPDQAPTHRSVIAVPLIIRKQIFGILSVSETQRAEPFNPDDLQLLELFAQQSAIAIQNAQLFEEVNRLAVTDGLTGIFNHRQVVSLTLQELERAKRYTMPFSIIMIDIDHFKQINDQCGHQAGDQVLRWLAQLCKSGLRFNDTIGRYGGEEFLVLLPNTPFSAGMQCAERLRHQVDRATFQNEQYQAKITISLGVAAWTVKTSTLEALLEAADQALYHSKQAGRNRVTGMDSLLQQYIVYPSPIRN